jgi:three-Cys-motif partner protein
VNSSVDLVMNELPKAGKKHRVLSFCFLDPFNMKNLHFVTVKKLSERFMDFLVLIPSGIEARNESRFISKRSRVMEDFCGSSDWRECWLHQKEKGKSFEIFAVEEYGRSMESLGYRDPGIENSVLIRSDIKNLPLYRLVLYSRHQLGKKFWNQARKYSDPQRDLFGN